jgi:formamidopyrimidine-DNA glycosylase
MPELPEVETLRRSLARRVVGARVIGVWTSGLPLRLQRPVPARALRRASLDRRIVAIRRVAKYLLVDTDAGDVIVIHLGMTGRVLAAAAATPRPPHTHVVWTLDDGRELRFVDPRRFGWITAARPGKEAELPELRVLGAEPLSLTVERLAALLARTRRAMKAFLMDQGNIAGLGNIYVSEALFLAGIHPAARADRLSAGAVARLRDAIVQVLRGAIANRGTTLRDYVDGAGRRGRNQFRLHVYGREELPCPRCGTPIRRVVDSGRSTFFCPACQKR